MILSDRHLALIRRAALTLSLVVIVLDQLTKYLVLTRVDVPEGGAKVILPVFSIVHWWNRGVSFGLFNSAQGAGTQLGILIMLTLAIVSALIYSLGRSTRALTIMGLGLIIGGALGNLFDRFTRGAVVDFLYFHWHQHGFPAFNLADSCVCVGVGLLLLDGLLSRKGDSSASFSDS